MPTPTKPETKPAQQEPPPAATNDAAASNAPTAEEREAPSEPRQPEPPRTIEGAASVAYTLIEAHRVALHTGQTDRAERYQKAALRICDAIAADVLSHDETAPTPA